MLPEKRMFGQHLGNIISPSLFLQGTRLSAQINTCHLHIKRLENLFFKPLLYFSPFPLNFCGQCNKSAVVHYRALLARNLPHHLPTKRFAYSLLSSHRAYFVSTFFDPLILLQLCNPLPQRHRGQGFRPRWEAPAKPSPPCIIRSAQLAPLRFSLSARGEPERANARPSPRACGLTIRHSIVCAPRREHRFSW